MKCYYHHDIDAVGVCKNCNKGISSNCLTDVGKGIACTTSCVEDVKALNRLVQTNIRRSKIAPYLLMALGLFFVYRGYADNRRSALLFVLGVFNIVWGAALLFAGSRKNNGNS